MKSIENKFGMPGVFTFIVACLASVVFFGATILLPALVTLLSVIFFDKIRPWVFWIMSVLSNSILLAVSAWKFATIFWWFFFGLVSFSITMVAFVFFSGFMDMIKSGKDGRRHLRVTVGAFLLGALSVFLAVYVHWTVIVPVIICFFLISFGGTFSLKALLLVNFFVSLGVVIVMILVNSDFLAHSFLIGVLGFSLSGVLIVSKLPFHIWETILELSFPSPKDLVK